MWLIGSSSSEGIEDATGPGLVGRAEYGRGQSLMRLVPFGRQVLLDFGEVRLASQKRGGGTER